MFSVFCTIIASYSIAGTTARTDSWIAARAFVSSSTAGNTYTRVVPLDKGYGRARITMYEVEGRTGKDKKVWTVVTEHAPRPVLVSANREAVAVFGGPNRAKDGVITLTFFSQKGKLLASYYLHDLLTPEETRDHTFETMSIVDWNVGAKYRFEEDSRGFVDTTLVLDFSWGKSLRFDMRTGRLMKDPKD
jgi:hypothetical protein